MADAQRLMAVMAHCDDAEIWAGGTICAHTAAGFPVLIVVLSGNADDPRGREARAGSQVMGAQLAFIGGRDRFLEATPDLIQPVAAQLALFRPTHLITHWPEDTHPDHVATAQIARRAVLTAEVENDLQLALACDTYLGWGQNGPFAPQLSIDVTATWSRKVAAIRCHASQDPDHYLNIVERQCWLHGARAQTGYAEGFRYLPFFGRTTSAQSWPPLPGLRKE